jgi:ATP-dependent protease ClpP protease subunit
MATLQSKLSLDEKLRALMEHGIDFEGKVLYLEGELNENLGTYLRINYAALKLFWEVEKKKPLEEITLDISSYGGSTYSIYGALDFYDEAKKEGVLINTKAQGICMSAATILLCGGTGVRMATKRCKLMLHDIQTEGIGGTVSQVKEYTKTLEKEQKELFGFYVEFTKPRNKKITEKQLNEETKKLIHRFASNSVDHYIDSNEALELRLIDKIL